MEVSVKNGKGTKRVMTRKNGEVKENTMGLSKTEMKNIQAGIFMPNLFHFASKKMRKSAKTRKTKKQKRE